MNQEETMLKHKERYKKTIKNLTVMSDIFARNVFKDKKACEYVLRIIMEDKDLTVIDNETQVDFRASFSSAAFWHTEDRSLESEKAYWVAVTPLASRYFWTSST